MTLVVDIAGLNQRLGEINFLVQQPKFTPVFSIGLILGTIALSSVVIAPGDALRKAAKARAPQ